MSQDNGQFVLDVDASDTAIGAVLQQHIEGDLRVIGYSSRLFNACEKNYCITRKELAGLVFGLKQYRQYLLGRRFVVRTDHAALSYLRTAKDLIGQQARWLDLMEEFNFELQHRTGTSHSNADALSRRLSCEITDTEPCRQCRKKELQGMRRGQFYVSGVTARPAVRTVFGGRAPLWRAAPIRTRQMPVIEEETSENASEEQWDVRAVQTRAQRQKEAALVPPEVVAPDVAIPEVEPDMSLIPVQESIDIDSPGVDNNLRGRRNIRRRGREVNIVRNTEQWTPEFLKGKQETDPDIKNILNWMNSDAKPDWNTVRAYGPSVKAYFHQFDSLIVKNGVLYRKLKCISPRDKEPMLQLVLPRSLRDEFLQIVHCGVAGHLGSFKTRAHVGQRAYWFKWRQDVDIFIKKCEVCCEYTRNRLPPKQGQLHPMTMGSPVERFCIDLAGPFPKSSSGHVYIMKAICAFSKFTILVPLRDKTAITVAKAIMEHVFTKFGCGEILTDNGKEFKCELLNELCRLMGVARAFTSTYQARTNSVCERNHATVNSMLSKCISRNQRDWNEHLSYIAFFYNASVNESTGFSPYFIMHGFEPRWDIDFKLGT